MHMTLHAILMIHMQKPGPGYYDGKKRINIQIFSDMQTHAQSTQPRGTVYTH